MYIEVMERKKRRSSRDLTKEGRLSPRNLKA